MIAGFGGHLISEQFLAQRIAELRHHSRAAEVREEFRRWREGHQSLGPASSLRSLLESAAMPLVAALGFDSPTDIAVRDGTAIATLRSRSSAVALVVSHWGERLEPL